MSVRYESNLIKTGQMCGVDGLDCRNMESVNKTGRNKPNCLKSKQ